MLNWRDFVGNGDVVRHTEAPGGEQVLAILHRTDGLYTFINLKWFGPWDEGDGPLDDGYWSVSGGGVFESADLAEREALSDGFWKLVRSQA